MNEYENNEFVPEQPAAEPQHEVPPQSNAYHGAGTGRKESPYANAPYVMNHQPEHTGYTHQEEQSAYHYQTQYQPQYEPPKAPKVKKQRKGLGKKILAAVLALALVGGSCGVTALLVNNRWEARVSSMEENFTQKIDNLQKQIDTSKSGQAAIAGAVSSGNQMTPSQVYAANVNSVVAISSTVKTSSFYGTSEGTATGSGFILTEDGYVITNYHVVEGATSVSVITHDGVEHPASIVGTVSANDIAVLHVDATDLPAVTVGSSDDLIIGDMVVAIGNPLGELTSTLTVGYVSAKERTVSTDGTVMNMIQTDAAINSGNSGGPLFNMKGEVVGITTAKYSGSSSSGASIEGIGFAIPMDDVLEELQELRDFGYIKSAYLGVMVQNMDTSVASIYGLPVGAYVVGVEEGYCAHRAGIQEKDIIVAVGDEKITTITDLTRALRDYEPGDKAKLTVYRAGQYMTLLVVLDERPAAVG